MSTATIDYIADLTSETELVENSPITNYFHGKTVFITGATGCIGQLILEKLLRIGAKKVYLLLRSKKERTPAQRLERLLDGPLFLKLRSKEPNIIHKVQTIEGEMDAIGLNICPIDLKELQDNVEIVIHSAADIRFDCSLLELVRVNLRGTREVLRLTESLKNLNMFVYVSTAYSHCYRADIKEEFYNCPFDPETIIRISEMVALNEDQQENFETMTAKLIPPWPNTYTYSKALSEELVRDYGNRFSSVVVRPSIVVATACDPIPGWLNNMSGINGVVFGIGMGFIRSMPAKGESKVDAICADCVTNSTLAAIAYTAEKRDKQLKEDGTKIETQVYNVVSGPLNPITLSDILHKLLEKQKDAPSTAPIWLGVCRLDRYNLSYRFFQIIYHACFALVFDIFLGLKKNKLRLMPLYRKCQNFMQLLEFFLKRSYNFDMKNMLNVFEWMTEYDKKLYPADMKNLVWDDFFYDYARGVRAYLTRDTSNDDDRQRKFNQLVARHYTFVYTWYALVVLFLYYIISRYFQ